jgi:hypothetical protein
MNECGDSNEDIQHCAERKGPRIILNVPPFKDNLNSARFLDKKFAVNVRSDRITKEMRSKVNGGKGFTKPSILRKQAFDNIEKGLQGAPTLEDYKKAEGIDERIREANLEIYRKILQPYGWRSLSDDFKDKLIYNYHAYHSGILEKILIAKEELKINVIDNFIGTLWIIGYTPMKIFHALMQSGYPGVISFKHVEGLIAQNKPALTEAKKEFEKGLQDERMKVFAALYKEINVAEEETLKIYIRSIGELNEKLETLSPVKDAKEYRSVSKLIDEITLKVNNAHGITDARKETIVAAGRAAQGMYAKRIKDIESQGVKVTPESLMGGMIEADTEVLSLEE